MNRKELRRFLLVCLAVFLIAVPAARAAGFEAADHNRQQEGRAAEIETLFQQLLDSKDVKPVFTDHGNGFYSLSAELEPEVRDRLLAALSDGSDKKAPQTFFVLSAGQQLTPPTDPTICIHSSLSLTNGSYNYWVVALNLGTKNVTANTNVKLTGPGLKFNKSIPVTYGANGIWAVWYNPSAGVSTPGIYTLQYTVGTGGTVSTKTFATTP